MIAKRMKLKIDINKFSIIDNLLFKILFDMNRENSNNVIFVNGIYWLLGKIAINDFFAIVDLHINETNRTEIESLKNAEF